MLFNEVAQVKELEVYSSSVGEPKMSRLLSYISPNSMSSAFFWSEEYGHYEEIKNRPELFLALVFSQKDQYGNCPSYLDKDIDTGNVIYLDKTVIDIEEKYKTTEDPSHFIITVDDEEFEIYLDQYVISRYDETLEFPWAGIPRIYVKKEEYMKTDLSDYSEEDQLAMYYELLFKD